MKLLQALSAFLLPALVLAADSPNTRKMTATQALETVLDTLRQGEKLDPVGQAKLVKRTMERIKKNYHDNLLVNDSLADVTGKTDPVVLRAVLWDVAGILSFQPNMEAPLPEGFPNTSTLGEIVVKSYPAYRRATTGNGFETIAFLTLFAHIQKENIAMTVPVEMNRKLREGAEKSSAPDSMSFLYGSQKLGQVSESGRTVKVVDMPAMSVVSVGLRGRPSEKQIDKYERSLREWIKTNRPKDVDQLGPPRILGYNDPGSEKQYWEIQLPLPRME